MALPDERASLLVILPGYMVNWKSITSANTLCSFKCKNFSKLNLKSNQNSFMRESRIWSKTWSSVLWSGWGIDHYASHIIALIFYPCRSTFQVVSYYSGLYFINYRYCWYWNELSYNEMLYVVCSFVHTSAHPSSFSFIRPPFPL